MKTYATIFTTDEYLEGVLVLNESLRINKSKYELLVIISKDISNRSEMILKNRGINVLRLNNKIFIPNNIKEINEQKGFKNWNDTIDKLLIFEMVQYEKIVYLDSDMIVLQNIDDLFDYPNMSAVVAGKSYKGNESWTKLNSGCMVIEPRIGISNEFINIIPEVIKERVTFGDQDVLQAYYNDWEYNNLELKEGYNIFYEYLDYYIKNLKYIKQDIYIVHFIGPCKPWMLTYKKVILHIAHLIKHKKIHQLKVFIKYIKMLNMIRRKNIYKKKESLY